MLCTPMPQIIPNVLKLILVCTRYEESTPRHRMGVNHWRMSYEGLCSCMHCTTQNPKEDLSRVYGFNKWVLGFTLSNLVLMSHVKHPWNGSTMMPSGSMYTHAPQLLKHRFKPLVKTCWDICHMRGHQNPCMYWPM